MKPLSERQIAPLLTVALWSLVVLVAIVSVFIARHLLADQHWDDFPPPVHRYYYATWLGALCAWRMVWGRTPPTIRHFRQATIRMLVLLAITVWMSLLYFAASQGHTPRVIATELSNLLFVFSGFGVASLVLLVVVFCFDEELDQLLRSLVPPATAHASTVFSSGAKPYGLDYVNMAQLGVYSGDDGLGKLYELWYLLKDLSKYGNLYLTPHHCDLKTLAKALHERGYVMYCGQEVPVFPIRDHSGVLSGIEIRVGRVPPQYTTI